MTVLLDTNIIMDALQERQPFDADAKKILQLAQQGSFNAMFIANAAADIFYLYRKARDINSARSALEFLLTQFGVVDVTHGDCINAIKLANEDFEDALLSVCAARINADCIVTRDEGFLKADSPVRTVLPEVFLSELE